LNGISPDLHLSPVANGYFINIHRFIEDLEKAFDMYKRQLLTDTSFQAIAVRRVIDTNMKNRFTGAGVSLFFLS
jgi:hypothetical protein